MMAADTQGFRLDHWRRWIAGYVVKTSQPLMTFLRRPVTSFNQVVARRFAALAGEPRVGGGFCKQL